MEAADVLAYIDLLIYGSSVPERFTHKQLEMHRCILGTVVTDALVLKHQAISIHSAD